MRHDRRLADRSDQPCERKLRLQLGDVRLVAQAALLEICGIKRGGELAVLLELGRLRDRLDHRVAAHDEVALGGLHGHDALRDHLVEHRAAHLGIVERRGIDAVAEHAPDLVLLRAQLVVVFAPRDVGAVHARYRVAAAGEAGIGLDPPGGERDRDQPEDDLHHAPVLLYEIEHEGRSGRDAILARNYAHALSHDNARGACHRSLRT